MSTKDKRGNNIRRGDRVKNNDGDEGVALSTSGTSVIVKWDDGTEEPWNGSVLSLANTGMGRRGK